MPVLKLQDIFYYLIEFIDAFYFNSRRSFEEKNFLKNAIKMETAIINDYFLRETRL